LPSQQNPAAPPNRNDDNRIGAREMVSQAPRAVAAVACVFHVCRMAAIGAKSVALMPMKEGTRLREHAELHRRQLTSNRQTSEIDKLFTFASAAGKPADATFINAKQNIFVGNRSCKCLKLPFIDNRFVAQQLEMPC
jgi:hypothetical protein